MEYGEQVFALLDVEDPSSYQGVDPNSGQGCIFLDRAGRVLYGSVSMLGEDGKGGHEQSCLMHSVNLRLDFFVSKSKKNKQCVLRKS